MALQDRAVNVLATINGELSGENPIVFVCHSYGGLLAKQMLFTSLGRAHNEYGNLAARVKGIVFLATPHNGSRIADYVNALGFILRSSVAIRELKQNAPHLRELAGWYRSYASKHGCKMRVFFETMNTRGIRVVDEDSSDPHIPDVTPIGVDADHISISKPPRPDVRLSQTNSLIAEILETSKVSSDKHSALAKLMAATDPDEFERLRRRYEMELEANPGNKELIDALSPFKRSSIASMVEYSPAQKLSFETLPAKNLVARTAWPIVLVLASVSLAVLHWYDKLESFAAALQATIRRLIW